ncbi:MAG: phosphoenolpyruvate kinase [Polyangiaceae bacterium]|jgi:citrate lyase beta subunit|nr:phosphoenolpyruvate kinase [Polyangiaceae bacterium]MBK8936984.1 phosphoenolpyruvate kinase [Polyangiaceae bacterium]
MRSVLERAFLDEIEGRLLAANARVSAAFPGEPARRQPVHTVYGGAHLFRRDTVRKLGALALRTLEEHGPTPVVFASALGLSGDDAFASTVRARVVSKLEREPVEDLRIDFEDGFGARSDAEEDEAAEAAAREVAAGLEAGTLPPFIGLRIKSLGEETRRRALRTLERFFSALSDPRRSLPSGFIVTVPKVTALEHVEAAADVLDALERGLGLERGALQLELMVETPQSILASDGWLALPRWAHAARGRLSGVHLGAYDLTAACGVSAPHQSLTHPLCDLARAVMAVSFSGTAVAVCDGATNVLPVSVHRPHQGAPLSADEELDNRRGVHAAWRLHFDHVTRAISQGLYQGWDLHPAQLPVRYAALYAFFLHALPESGARLTTFLERAAQATLRGTVFDDAATGQGLLNTFLRGLACGAFTDDDVQEATTLTPEELRLRSFAKILERRTGEHGGPNLPTGVSRR